MGRLPLSHRVPTGLMLPMICAAAEYKVLLAPDDLAANLEACGKNPDRYLGGIHPSVPNVHHVPGEQRISRSPVDPVVICYLAGRMPAAAIVLRAATPGHTPLHTADRSPSGTAEECPQAATAGVPRPPRL